MKTKSLVNKGHIIRTITVFFSRKASLVLAGMAFAVVALPLAAGAMTTISHGYSTKEGLPLGSIVSMVKDSSDEVSAATVANADGIFGVVINDEGSLLSVSNGHDNQVQVATSGTVPVLVSDINGKITRGDHITASPIAGVGMKASGNVRVIGIAQSDLNGGSKQDYKDSDGRDQTVMLGQVPVLVSVAYFFKEPEKTVVPATVQNVANAIAGRSVDTMPILISAAIFIVTLTVVVSIIYAMIRSSIISVGRNPMSQSAIYRNLIQLSALVLMILGVGFASIYMVLTRL